MLVLSRRVNERILIGENIRLTIVSTRGNQVRIGIEAPDDIRIYREEVYNIRRQEGGSPMMAERYPNPRPTIAERRESSCHPQG